MSLVSNSSHWPRLFDLIGYRRRWQMLSALSPAYVSESAPLIIGGCGRSGTTLLQAILANHPEILARGEATVFLGRVSRAEELDKRFGLEPGETEDLQRKSRSQAEFIDLFQRLVLHRSAKTVWAEKTPANVLRLGFIFRHFPNARFIHIIRDGRDVACSLRRQTWMKMGGHHPASPEALCQCADYWVRNVEAGRHYRHHPRCIEIRYRDVVTDTERTLRRIIDFLGLDWATGMLEPARVEKTLGVFNRSPTSADDGLIHTTTVGRWQREFSQREKDVFKERAGRLLIELGYEKDLSW